MSRTLVSSTLTIFMLCLIFSFGCSGATSIPTSPAENPILDTQQKEAQSERMLWGIWQFSYDQASGEVVPIPLRDADAHYKVTSFALPPSCNNCLTIHVNYVDTVTHIIDADVTLRNASSYTAYDVRFIVYTNNYGHELLDPDGWTGLWDITGGQAINPFRAYAKLAANRSFLPSNVLVENFQVNIPDPPQLDKITFAIDASLPGNCQEPYEINNFGYDPIHNTPGSSANIYVDVLDWQYDVNTVNFSCVSITGVDSLPLSQITDYTWSRNIENATGAPAGDYQAKLTATSANSGSLALSDFVTITITEMPPWDGFARTWGGTGIDYGFGEAVDGSGNIYVTGFFQDSNVDFDPGGGSDLHSSNGETDGFVSKFDSSGAFQWARTWGGAGSDVGNEVATDSSGNVYVTGYFDGANVDFNPGAGVNPHSSNGGADIFINKFNSSGTFQWAQTCGGTGDDFGSGVAADSSGNVYVTGYFDGSNVDFDPGAGVDLHSSNGLADIFLSKFGPNGTFQWAYTWGGISRDVAIDIAADSSANVYVTGYFKDINVDFNPGAGVNPHSSNGGADVFISKFNSSGTFQWARTWGGTTDDCGVNAAADISGNVYLTGYFTGSNVDFNPGAGSDPHSSNGNADIFLSKFTPTGDFQWAHTWGGTSDDVGLDVAADGSGNVYVTGYFGGLNVDFDPGAGSDLHSSNGEEDVFVSKFYSAGTFQTARTWGGTGFDRGYEVVEDGSGNVYVTGIFTYTVDFDPGSGVEDHPSNGSYDVFLSRIFAVG